MCFVHFVKHAPTVPTPGQVEALSVFRFAVSGLWALLEGQDMGHGWGTLARAYRWAMRKTASASQEVTRQQVQDLTHALNNPHLLPGWGHEVRQAGQEKEAGHFAAWLTVSHLLETAPHLQDGSAEDLTAAMLEALAPGLTSRFDPPALHFTTGQPGEVPASSPSPGVVDALSMIQEGAALMRENQAEVPGVRDFTLTVQSVQALPGGRARLEVPGGEGYEVSRAEQSAP